jgi:hypothetical protein
LTGATIAAFFAAAYYGCVAKQTLKQIETQTVSIKISADAAKSAADVAEQTLVAVQRPFVRFDSFSVQTFVRDNPDVPYLQITANWENSGITPATDVVGSFRIEELPNAPSGETFIKPEGALNSSIYIGPKGRLQQGIQKPLSFFTGGGGLSDIRKYNIEKLPPLRTHQRIFVWGWIFYRDVFPNTKPHLTEFAQEITGIASAVNRSEPGASVKMTLAACDQHNCVDDYCADYDKIINLVINRNKGGVKNP